jgi:hypothetical protein
LPFKLKHFDLYQYLKSFFLEIEKKCFKKIGYQISIPVILNKEWQNAICNEYLIVDGDALNAAIIPTHENQIIRIIYKN